MPVHRVHRGGRVGYQWGDHGKSYFGPGAEEKAALQGRAAYAHGYRGSRMSGRSSMDLIEAGVAIISSVVLFGFLGGSR